MTPPILQTLTLSLKHAYQQLLSPLWVFDIDRQGMVWANQAAIKLWQAESLESLVMHDFASGMSEATHTRLSGYLEHFKSGGDNMESWTFYPSGQAKTVRCHCSGVLLEDQRLVMLVQASIDAAGEPDMGAVRGVEALRHTSVMITLCTQDGDALTENPAAFRSYAFTTRDKAAKHAFLDRFADKQVAKQALDALQRDTRFSGEVRMLTNAGEQWHSIDAFCTTDPATGAPAILINESNITRMMLAEKRVRAAHDELEETVTKRTAQLKEAHIAVAKEKTFVSAVLDAVGSLVIVTTPSGEIVRVNRAVCALSGLSSKQLLGRTCGDVLAAAGPDNRSDWHLGFCVASDGTIPSASEGHMRSASGDERLIVWSHAVLHKADGTPEHLIAAGLDVSERRELQGRLQLADRMASVGTLAAGVAHEVNNPLTYVMSNLELLRDALDKPQPEHSLTEDEMAECSTDALAGAERIKRIVRDLSSFSRASATLLEPIDLQKVIDFTLNLADHQVRPRARLLRSSAPIPLVLGNEARLGQVVLNLLVNAAQAIPEGDALENVISIRTFTDAQGFCVAEIKDTGSGIAPEHLAQIFDPFFTTKATTNGTGLGLSICHRIVSEMGGKLTAESRLGHGATFRLSLPATAAHVSAANKRRTSPEPVRACKVLVVDDEKGILRVFQRTLDAHEVVVCHSGNAVPNVVQSQGPFDVIFCDLTMPDGTGADVFRALARVSPEHVKRLVFMTGGVSTAEMRAFLEEVPNECLEKPIGTDRIRAVIADHIFDEDKADEDKAGPLATIANT